MYARKIFDAVKDWDDVQSWVDRREEESLHLDFKQKTSASQVDLDIEDRKNLAKALSGFANTEGGVLVFGIETKKKQGGPDQASAIRPIANITQFKARVEDHIARLTDPPVSVELQVVEHSSGHGVLLILIPQSDGGPHRAMGPGDVKDRYFMRLSDRTEPMPHTFLAAMFGRRPPPQLYLTAVLSLSSHHAKAELWIGNAGRGYAERPAVGLIQNPDRNNPDEAPGFWWHLFQPAKGWDSIVLPAGGTAGIGCLIRADVTTMLYPGIEIPLGSIDDDENTVHDPFIFSIHGNLYAANGQPSKFGIIHPPRALPSRFPKRHVETFRIPIL